MSIKMLGTVDIKLQYLSNIVATFRNLKHTTSYHLNSKSVFVSFIVLIDPNLLTVKIILF